LSGFGWSKANLPLPYFLLFHLAGGKRA
jgi:hypothetical protein